MSLLICPVCASSLERCGNAFKCENSHSFDISRTGDVYLLRSSKSEHGDSREMIVARRDFLNLGFYGFLADALAKAADEHLEKKDVVYLDAGCGTGYYTERVKETLSKERRVEALGIDLSKDAVKMCAKRIKDALFAVASVYSLPIRSESVDLITNVFSPQADEEYARVLKKDGILLYVVPSPRHLYSMKEVLYENPYENEDKEVEYKGFRLLEKRAVQSVCRLDRAALESLFKMTPYFWTTSREGSARLLKKEFLDVEFSFYIYVFKKDEI